MPQPSPSGWVMGQAIMHEPCKGGIQYVAPQCHSSPRKARCWREAKSASSFAKDARCTAFNRSTADTCAANSRCRGSGGTKSRASRTLDTLMVFKPDVVFPARSRMHAKNADVRYW